MDKVIAKMISFEKLCINIRTRRICIVGNATMSKDHGEEIDDYDAIIRINFFIIAPCHYKTYGSKTTFVSVSRNMGSREDVPTFCVSGAKHPYPNVIYPERGYSEALMDAGCVPRPSTGACTIVALAENMQNPVHVYGFDWMKTAHYWDNKIDSRTNKMHNFPKEEEFFRKYKKAIIHE